jgi:hypothetical protein
MPARGGRHRSRRRTWLLSVVAVATAALIGTTTSLVASSAQADQATQGIDNLRTNWDQNEAKLSPSMVQSSAFGRLFATKLDGQIYAQPLVLGDHVIAVTESNTVYGLDRTTGEIIRVAAQYVHSSRDNTNLSTWGAWQYFTVRP